MKCAYFDSVTAVGIDAASVEYGYNSFLRAVGTDADKYVSCKNIASHSNKIADSCKD